MTFVSVVLTGMRVKEKVPEALAWLTFSSVVGFVKAVKVTDPLPPVFRFAVHASGPRPSIERMAALEMSPPGIV